MDIVVAIILFVIAGDVRGIDELDSVFLVLLGLYFIFR